MVIRVRYFAALREQLGSEESVGWQSGMTLASLRALLAERGGAHAELLAAQRPVRASVDMKMSTPDAAVPDGAEVAFFPPVTGG